MGHYTPESGSALDVCDGLYNLLLDKGGIGALEAVGCDGTVTNTGWKNGIIRCLERKIERPLQWIICLLHFNELPFRALFIHLDGVTEGPSSFTGPIGKELKGCEKKPVVNYKKIDFIIPTIDREDLSEDQKYLLDICIAIKSGICSLDLSLNNPGTLNHSRWLTCSNRLLRLYVATPKTNTALKTIVTYILKVYAPLWFSIRKEKSFSNGSKHLFKAILLSRYLPSNLKKIVDSCIARNAYFALPKNILVAFMCDARHNVRLDALNKILKVREKEGEENQMIKSTKLPKINFNANDYFELVD